MFKGDRIPTILSKIVSSFKIINYRFNMLCNKIIIKIINIIIYYIIYIINNIVGKYHITRKNVWRGGGLGFIL